MVNEEDSFYAMDVEEGRIKKIYRTKEEFKGDGIDLKGKHVYPCLIDGHVHLLLTVAVMAMGFNICEITEDGVKPSTVEGALARLKEYADKQKKDAIIACNNYILTAIDERRMPTKEELDIAGSGRPVVIYNIDGHSTALSTAMLKLVGIDPRCHNGILQGEENERTQGRIIDTVGGSISIPTLAKGVANFQNYCAEYGINIVGALEGNGDSEKDVTTHLIARLSRHMDIGVRLYLQYTDLDRVKPFKKWMKNPRVGGCGDWEMDGATGSHSAAFIVPFNDTGKTSPCYYSQQFVDNLCARADTEGYQIASHAIGELAIERIIEALDKTKSGKLHRIEHCEFHDDESFEKLKEGKYAVMMQPGYAWIDKRYLNTYTQYLPKDIVDRMKFKSLYDAGVVLCGSSDSPVQDMDPYLQMLGMTQFYNPLESITPFEALTCYTKNAAKAILEEGDYGTLEEGKVADFFVAEKDFFKLKPEEVVSFRPEKTYYGGKPWVKKKGTTLELLKMMLTKAKKI